MTSPCNIFLYMITYSLLFFNHLCYFIVISLVFMHVQVRYTIIINSTTTQYVLQSIINLFLSFLSILIQISELIIILITIRNILITFRCIVMFILINFHLTTANATVPYKQTDIQTDILCKRKEVPEGTPFTTNHIHFYRGQSG